MPHELDDVEPGELARAIEMLDAYRVQQAANRDLKSLTEAGLELYGHLEELRRKQDR